MAERKTKELEVWLLVDANGDWVTSEDEQAIGERYDELVGGDGSVPRRVVKVTLKVPLPRLVELSGTVPVKEEVANWW